MIKKRIGLVGYGNYGRFAARHLSGWFDVRIYDPAAGRKDLPGVLRAGIILLAIPVASIGPFLKKAAGLLRPESLIVDLSSVKTKPLGLLTRKLKNPVIGVHTLFGPESAANGLSGLPAVLTPGSADRASRLHVRRFLEKKLKLKVIEMSGGEHDRQMAWVQGLSHFVAKALQNMAVPALPHKTASFEKFSEMSRILRHTTWPLFETIENQNPWAAPVRKRFVAELARLERRLSGRGKKGSKR